MTWTEYNNDDNNNNNNIQNESIIENGQNTTKSPGDLRELAVTQTPVKNYQLTLMWKALMSA